MDISMKPVMMKKMPFGKYKGYDIKTMIQADPGYVRWLLNNKEFEEGDSLKYTIDALMLTK
jgi:uncharacterized protein (DUF3820 family)